MFESVSVAPADPILGITEAFTNNPSPNKINLSVGVYKDATGVTPILDCVRSAEARLLEAETSKSYKPITGAADYAAVVQELLFGAGHEVISSGRAVTAHTPGGTGALRVAGDYIHQLHPQSTLWLSEPTWANHPKVFAAAGVPTKTYSYFNGADNSLDLSSLLSSLGDIPSGDVVLLHGCCHNPTGVDPTPEEWTEIAKRLASRGVIPLLDFAYQGFGEGLVEDGRGLAALAAENPEFFVCSSFSKNFGLYNERVGALTVVGRSAEEAAAVFSHLKATIRANYSNPPAHGAAIVTTVLQDSTLLQQWEGELKEMRDRINGMRSDFVAGLAAAGVPGDFSFIERQRGMFSFSGLTKEHVQRLRDEHSIYIVASGRINVAGMTPANMPQLCEAIAKVVA